MPSMVPSCCDCINVSNRSWSIQQHKDHSNWTRRLSLPQRIHSLGGHLLYYDPCNTLAMVTQMRSRSGRSPWFLAYDPYIDAVILSIRGTKSLRDVMTSINNRSLFPSFTIRTGSYSAQCGYYTTALNISSRLRALHVLEGLFHNYRPTIPIPQYVYDAVFMHFCYHLYYQ